MTGSTVRIIHSGRILLASEALEQLDALGEFLADLLAAWFRACAAWSSIDLLGQVHAAQGIAHRLGAHLGHEGICAVGFAGFAVFVFAQQLMQLERGRCRDR